MATQAFANVNDNDMVARNMCSFMTTSSSSCEPHECELLSIRSLLMRMLRIKVSKEAILQEEQQQEQRTFMVE